MAIKPGHPTRRPCPCGGANPNCPQCGGKGVIELPGVRTIMAGPAGVRRRPWVSRESVGTIQGPPEPTRCPHCGMQVLHLPSHLTEAHPELPQQESAAEREAREQEEARQAAVAAEIARREAEAARRKAEARARRQEFEGPQAAAWSGPVGESLQRESPSQQGVPGRPAGAAAQADPTAPAGESVAGSPDQSGRQPSGRPVAHGAGPESRPASPEDQAWERIRRALAERTVLTGVIRSRKPFGVFVDLGGIEGLVRTRELPPEDPGREAPGWHDGQTVKVLVIGLREDPRRVELSMRRAEDPRTPRRERGAAGPEGQPPEGPMALAFRLAQERKRRAE